MKIIGHTNGGYLLEAGMGEVERLGEGINHKGAYSGGWEPLKVGTEFRIDPVVDHMHELRRKAENARQGAAFLRGLAEILDKGLPDWIAEPAPPAEPATETSNG